VKAKLAGLKKGGRGLDVKCVDLLRALLDGLLYLGLDNRLWTPHREPHSYGWIMRIFDMNPQLGELFCRSDLRKQVCELQKWLIRQMTCCPVQARPCLVHNASKDIYWWVLLITEAQRWQQPCILDDEIPVFVPWSEPKVSKRERHPLADTSKVVDGNRHRWVTMITKIR